MAVSSRDGLFIDIFHASVLGSLRSAVPHPSVSMASDGANFSKIWSLPTQLWCLRHTANEVSCYRLQPLARILPGCDEYLTTISLTVHEVVISCN